MAKGANIQAIGRAAMLGLLSLAGVVFAAVTASAQSRAQERVYVDLGNWTISTVGDSRTCTLRYSGSQGTRLVMTKTGTGSSVLTLELANRNLFVGNVVFAFDEDEFPAQLQGGRLYTPDAGGSAIESAFRQSRVLALRQGGATLTSLSLNASSAGFRLLKQCAEQGRLGIARAPAPPAPEPAPEPARDPAPVAPPPVSASATPPPSAEPSPRSEPSLARNAQPISPGSWIGDTDRLNFPSRGWSGGILRFTLAVDPRGRAGDCVVDRSTGDRRLDEQLCRQLQRRARFEPATNAQGNPVQGSFTSSLRISPPE